MALAKRNLLVGMLLAALVVPAHASSPVSVAATDSIYSSGDGSTPPTIIMLSGATSAMFAVSTGNTITYNGGGNYNNADGIGSASASGINGVNGLSGINSYDAGFLSGVFVDASGGVVPVPPTLSYNSAAETAFASASPLLNQVFFIGDGLTGSGSGATQTFFVPTGATQLLLGFADASGYFGNPSSYGDNSGSLSVTANLAGGTTSATPEAATWAMLILGLGVIGGSLRMRKTAARSVARDHALAMA